jgi:hypothetical protein
LIGPREVFCPELRRRSASTGGAEAADAEQLLTEVTASVAASACVNCRLVIVLIARALSWLSGATITSGGLESRPWDVLARALVA